MPDQEASGRSLDSEASETDVVESEAMVQEERLESANASARQLLRNFGAGYTSLLLSVGISLLLTPILLHRLGAADYGLWVTLILAGSYLGLLDSGVSTAAVQRVAAATATGDMREVSTTLATARLFFRLTALVAVVISLVVVPEVGTIFSLSQSSVHAARLAIPLIGLLTAVQFLNSVPTAGLFGGGRSDLLSLIGLVSSVAVQLAQIAVVVIGGGLAALAGVALGGAVISYVWSRITQRRVFPYERSKPSRAVMRQLISHGGRNMVVGLGGSLSYGIDSLIIATVLPIQRVAPYDIAMSTASFTRSLATAGTNVLLPTYAHTDASGDQDRQFRLFAAAVSASLVITVPIYVALVAFGEPLLRLWLGKVPPETYKVVVWLGLSFMLQLPGNQSFIFLTGVRRLKLLARLALPVAAANVGLSYLFTPILGPIGPVVASLPQVCVLEFCLLPILCCRYLGKGVRDYAKQALLPLVAPALTVAALCALLRVTLGAPSPVAAPFEAVLVVLGAWAAAVIRLGLDPIWRERGRRLARRIVPVGSRS